MNNPAQNWRFGVSFSIPFLTRACPFGFHHWCWQSSCLCAVNVPDEEAGWHGGIYDLDTGIELQPCMACYEEVDQEEEEVLVESWRAFRADFLAHHGDEGSYSYRIYVEHDGIRETLMSRNTGVAMLSDERSISKPS